MGDLYSFGSENGLIPGIAKGNKVIAWRSSMTGPGTQRKGLLDVTNFEQNAKLSYPNINTLQLPTATRECMDQLLKENLELKKTISDQNKLIELAGAELRNSRENMQKLHQQNRQLTQANSHMLADLNNGKDRLKAMQHELGCLKCVLAVKDAKLLDMKKVVDDQQTSNSSEVQEAKLREQGDIASLAGNKELKHSNTNNKRQSRASSTSAALMDAAVKEKGETKRSGKRRQSNRLSRSEEPGSSTEDDLFDIDETQFHIVSQRCGDTKCDESKNTKKEKEESIIGGSLPAAMRRSSIGRPMRQAAVKVNNYKEAPLNVKMRRTS